MSKIRVKSPEGKGVIDTNDREMPAIQKVSQSARLDTTGVKTWQNLYRVITFRDDDGFFGILHDLGPMVNPSEMFMLRKIGKDHKICLRRITARDQVIGMSCDCTKIEFFLHIYPCIDRHEVKFERVCHELEI